MSTTAHASSCMTPGASRAPESHFQMFAHDDELAERACAAGVVRSVCAVTLDEANDWRARCEAASLTPKRDDRATSETAPTRARGNRGRGRRHKRQIDAAREPTTDARDNADKNMLQDIGEVVDTETLKRSIETDRLASAFRGVVDARVKTMMDFVVAWCDEARDLERECQETYEKTLESTMREHERAYAHHEDATRRFDKLAQVKDASLETRKELDATSTEIAGLVATLERLEQMIKTKSESFTSYFNSQITFLIRKFADGAIDGMRESEVAIAGSVGSGSIEALKRDLRESPPKSKIELESPPTPPKLMIKRRSASPTPRKPLPVDEGELEEGEIAPIEKGETSASATAAAA